jgi:hypothetical protein
MAGVFYRFPHESAPYVAEICHSPYLLAGKYQYQASLMQYNSDGDEYNVSNAVQKLAYLKNCGFISLLLLWKKLAALKLFAL